LVSLLVSSTVILGVALFFFHTSAKYQMIDHLIDRVSVFLGSTVKSIFLQQRDYIKQNFYDVARATEFYNKDINVYFDKLLTTAGKQERSLETFKKFQIWFTEFFIMFVCFIAVIICVLTSIF
jgi:hypothetical protein